VRRREFITLVGGAASWPMTARAQNGEGMPRITVLSTGEQGDLEPRAFVAAIEHGMRTAGRTAGVDVGLDYYWVGTDAKRVAAAAAEVAGLNPTAIVTMPSFVCKVWSGPASPPYFQSSLLTTLLM
jgi:putative ABC transport system substrate-binding protein